MKTRKIVFFGVAALLIALCSSCREGKGIMKYYDSNSYVVMFSRPAVISVKPITVDGFALGLRIYSDKVAWTCNATQTGLGGQFDKLCLKYGDTGLPHQIYTNFEIGLWVPDGPRANADSYASISVTCSKDWDANHLSGTSLADVIWFNGWSFYPYIHSRYTLPAPRTNIFKKLDQVTPQEMMMLGEGEFEVEICKLLFEQAPAVPGVYPITVTLTTDEGEVSSLSWDFTFK
ncbi:MAG: hypothetical protein RR330_00855 [Alistipes sp.]